MIKNAKLIVVPTMMLAMGMLLVGCSGDVSKKSPVQEESKEVKAGPGINIENYDKIVVGDKKTGEGGSTYAEVVALLGQEAPGKASMKMGGVAHDQFQWFEGGMSNAEDILYINFIDGLVNEKLVDGFGQ